VRDNAPQIGFNHTFGGDLGIRGKHPIFDKEVFDKCLQSVHGYILFLRRISGVSNGMHMFNLDLSE
jgi:hypothetical protein